MGVLRVYLTFHPVAAGIVSNPQTLTRVSTKLNRFFTRKKSYTPASMIYSYPDNSD